jgi:dienelactone hydrolase
VAAAGIGESFKFLDSRCAAVQSRSAIMNPDELKRLSRRPLVWSPPQGPIEVAADLRYRREPSFLFDVYRPAAGPGASPTVVLVHGEAPPELIRNAKGWGQYRSWGKAIASSGLAAVTFNHRSTYDVPAREVEADLVELLATLGRDRTYLRIDVDRLALFAISAGVPLALVSALNGTCADVRSVVAYYGPPDLRPYGPDREFEEFSPILYLEGAERRFPILMVKAGQDNEIINNGIDAFVSMASNLGWPVELLVHETGQHAFDIVNDDARSAGLIRATLDFLTKHLSH